MKLVGEKREKPEREEKGKRLERVKRGERKVNLIDDKSHRR
jgi:hypothetical protein